MGILFERLPNGNEYAEEGKKVEVFGVRTTSMSETELLAVIGFLDEQLTGALNRH